MGRRDRVVDRLEDRRVRGDVGGTKGDEADKAGAGGDTLDADEARTVERQRAEVADVVDLAALRGDRRRVAERLRAAGRRRRAEAAEVLEVDEHVLAVGANEIGIVGVERVGDPTYGDACTGDPERPGRLDARVLGVDPHRPERLWLELHLPGGRAGARKRCGARLGGFADPIGRRRREVDDAVGNDLGHGRIRPQRRDLRRGHGRRYGVERGEAVHPQRVRGGQFMEHLRLDARERLAARSELRTGGGLGAILVLEHHDHALRPSGRMRCRRRGRREHLDQGKQGHRADDRRELQTHAHATSSRVVARSSRTRGNL